MRSSACLALLVAFSLAIQAGPGASAQTPCCELLGRHVADRSLVSSLDQRRFTHRDLWEVLQPLLAGGDFTVTDIGQSVQGRTIRAVSFGAGPVTVLLWSQMHGDESTATMALVDIIGFLAADNPDPLRDLIRQELRVVMIPMLNPDGAERFQRFNAVGVDVNRDARRLATPEGRTLRAVRDSLAPAFGFNLHDQGARTTAGAHGHRVAIALLAPPADSSRAYGPVRERAHRLAALLAIALRGEIPGRIARYDDTFNPRAFGDLIQQWGTSTVLIESGALPEDAEKQGLRRLNVMLLLTALEAIATNRFAELDPAPYDSLPFNNRVAGDILVRGGSVVLPGGEAIRLDLALLYDDPVARGGMSIGEIGDLDGTAAMDTLDVNGLFLHISSPSTFDPANWWLIRGEPMSLVIREGPEVDSRFVRQVP